MSTFLPQHDSFMGKAERLIGLKRLQYIYEYNYTHVPTVAMLNQLPISDQFSLDWLRLVGQRVLDGAANRTELESGAAALEIHRVQHKELRELLELGTNIFELSARVMEALKFSGRMTASKSHAKNLKDFADMFREIGLPPISKDFANDRSFAALRLAGPNPVMLKRVSKLDDRLPLDAESFRRAVVKNAPGSKDSLSAALAEGRLYLADYALLDGAELGTLPNGQKYLYAPLALFVVTGPKKELLPVAIQCSQKPSKDSPIFTPEDGYNWLIAKTIVETADGNLHEASTHLARTHLVMEAFVMATYRQLSHRHPLGALLGPHFEGTLAINDSSWKHLVSVGGAVDKLLSGTIDTSRKVAALGLQTLDLMESRLPLTFNQRGVADREALPDYPYRDDSTLYWDAIHQWVNDYVKLYYKSDVDVQQDHELQAWGRELTSQEGGRLKGLPHNGALQTVSEVIEVISFVIYTCSAQHAAVNFPQYDCMSYVPMMPLAGYRPAPKTKTGATEADYLAMLPTLDMAELQMEVTYLLGSVHYTQLGQYREGHFADARVAAPLKAFQKRLTDIGTTIAQRNKTRRPYETLAPVGIPQSINI